MSGIELDIKAYFVDEKSANAIQSTFDEALAKGEVDLTSAIGKLKPGERDFDVSRWSLRSAHRLKSCLRIFLYGKAEESEVCELLEALGASLISISAYNDQAGEHYNFGWQNGKSVSLKTIDAKLKKLDPFIAFQEAIVKGQTKLVESFINEGIDVDSSLNGIMTPVMHAAASGRTAVIRQLIKAGAQVDKLVGDNLHALLYATIGLNGDRNNLPTIELLLKNGANPNLISKNPYITQHGFFQYPTSITPLMFAASFSPEALDLLIDYGADVNLKTPQGYSALTFALEADDIKGTMAVCRLIKAGANVNLVDEDGKNCLDHTTPDSPKDFILRTHGARYQTVEYSGDHTSDLILALETDDLEKVKQLSQHIDINETIDRGSYKIWPLVKAIQQRRFEIARFMIDLVPDLREIDTKYISDQEQRRSLLFRACEAGCIDVVELLLEHGIDSAFVNNRGESALDKAFNSRLPDEYSELEPMIKLLLDVKIPFGNSLAAALESGREEVVEMLVEANALDAVSDPAKLMRSIIYSRNLDFILKYRQWMQDQGFSLQQLTVYASQTLEELEFNVNASRVFIENEIDVNQAFDGEYRCPLHVVVKALVDSGSITGRKSILLLQLLDALLDAGANDPADADPSKPNLVMELQKTQGRDAVIEKLLRHGANVNHLADVEGWVYSELLNKPRCIDGEINALMLAADNGNLDYVKLLVENGANPKYRNAIDGSPLDIAEKNNHKSVADYLRELQ